MANITYVTGDLMDQLSGPYVTLNETVQHISKLGYKARIIGTSKTSSSFMTRAGVNQISIRRFGPNSAHLSYLTPDRVNQILEGSDLLSIHGVWMMNNLPFVKWARNHSIPILLTAHGNFNPYALSVSRWKKKLLERLFKKSFFDHASVLHALTEAEVSVLRDYGFKQPIALIPNGFNAEQYNVKGDDLIVDRKNIRKRKCVYLGRIHPIKGLERLLEAWSKCSSEGWELIIAGGGDESYFNKIRAYARDKSIHNVVFTGAIFGDEKQKLISDSDFMVLTSFSEGFPVSVLEGLSLRRRSLVTKECGLASLAKKGFVVEVEGTDSEISRGLSLMMSCSPEDIKLNDNMSAKYLNDNFSWEKVATDLDKTYLWMLGRHPKPEFIF